MAIEVFLFQSTRIFLCKDTKNTGINQIIGAISAFSTRFSCICAVFVVPLHRKGFSTKSY